MLYTKKYPKILFTKKNYLNLVIMRSFKVRLKKTKTASKL